MKKTVVFCVIFYVPLKQSWYKKFTSNSTMRTKYTLQFPQKSVGVKGP